MRYRTVARGVTYQGQASSIDFTYDTLTIELWSGDGELPRIEVTNTIAAFTPVPVFAQELRTYLEEETRRAEESERAVREEEN